MITSDTIHVATYAFHGGGKSALILGLSSCRTIATCGSLQEHAGLTKGAPTLQPFDLSPSGEAYLYHYTTAETALTKIMPQRKLRAGSFLYMNDPREAKRWNLSFRHHLSDESIKAYCSEQGVAENDIRKTVSRIAQSSAHLICFSMDNLPRREDSSNFGNETGRGFAHSAMWSHYAARHAGVCLIFDKRILERAIRASEKKAQWAQGSRGLWIYHGEVSYRDVSFNTVAAQLDDPYCISIEDNMSLQQNVSRACQGVPPYVIFPKEFRLGVRERVSVNILVGE